MHIKSNNFLEIGDSIHQKEKTVYFKEPEKCTRLFCVF